MKIEVEKYYLDRHGEIHGPIEYTKSPYMNYIFEAGGYTWTADGRYDDDLEDDKLDLVEECYPQPSLTAALARIKALEAAVKALQEYNEYLEHKEWCKSMDN